MERKARLCELVRRSRCPRLLYAQHVEGGGKELFKEICRCDLEGICGETKDGRISRGSSRLVKDQKQNVFAGRGKARIVDENEELGGYERGGTGLGFED
jgi:hypothetical protein